MTDMAAQRCGYCDHARAAHARPEPGNPPPSLRCGRGCVCPAFIEADGRTDWQHAAEAARRAGGATDGVAVGP